MALETLVNDLSQGIADREKKNMHYWATVAYADVQEGKGTLLQT